MIRSVASGALMMRTALLLLLSVGATACGPRELQVTMSEDNSSGQTGTAVILDYGDRYTIEVHITAHPTETGAQLLHIHPNRCGSIGAPILALTPLEAGHSFTEVTPDGDASTPDELSFFRSADHAINAHLSSNAAIYVSCGNIPRL